MIILTVAPIQGADLWGILLPGVSLHFTLGCDIAPFQGAFNYDTSNEPFFKVYRKAISDSIPELCDILDNVGDWNEVTSRDT